MKIKIPKKDIVSWAGFSATATISAFLLPIHIWANRNFPLQISQRPVWLIVFATMIILFAAVFHSLYRMKTLCSDLHIKNKEKIGTTIEKIQIAAFVCLILLTIILLLESLS